MPASAGGGPVPFMPCAWFLLPFLVLLSLISPRWNCPGTHSGTGGTDGAVSAAGAPPEIVEVGAVSAAGAPPEAVAAGVDPAAEAGAGCPDIGALLGQLAGPHLSTVRLHARRLDGNCVVSVRGDDLLCAASTIKLLALAATLEQMQQSGQEPDEELAGQLDAMIGRSDNAAASAVIGRLERDGDTFPAIGARWGVPGAQNPSWGRSPVSAAQLSGLVAAMFAGGRLDERSVQRARRLLDLPDKDFSTGWRAGVGYGAPDGWYRGSKVGVLTCDASVAVHAAGLLEDPAGTQRWAVAFLSDGWDSEAQGDQALNDAGALLTEAIMATVR